MRLKDLKAPKTLTVWLERGKVQAGAEGGRNGLPFWNGKPFPQEGRLKTAWRDFLEQWDLKQPGGARLSQTGRTVGLKGSPNPKSLEQWALKARLSQTGRTVGLKGSPIPKSLEQWALNKLERVGLNRPG